VTRIRLTWVLLLVLPSAVCAGDFESGLKALEKKDYTIAITYFSACVRANPNDPAPYTFRGNAYVAKGDFYRAFADYDLAIRLNPKDLVPYVNRGVAHQRKGDVEKAVADWTEAIRLDPKLAHAYMDRGNAYAGRRDYDRAVADYTQALRLEPRNASAYNNRGLMYAGQGQYDRAVADFTQAARLEPRNPLPWRNHAWLLASCRQEGVRNGKKAVQLATKACELSGWNEAASLGTLAAAQAESGNFPEAIRLERRALEVGYANRGEADKAQQRLQLYEAGQPCRE
jgi:tetratricopeptide (TPR) repeat protein